jgi:sec-independent protein translocase protein TatB
MFDIGWSEMAVILVVALIVIGPKDLPRVARSVGRWVAKGRAMAREFQDAIEDMAREAELDKVKKEIENAGRTDIGKTIERTVDPSGELGKAFDPTGSGRKPPKASSKAESAKGGEAKPVKAEPEPELVKAEPEVAQAAKPVTPEPVAEPEKSSRRVTSHPARPNGQAAERETVSTEPN